MVDAPSEMTVASGAVLACSFGVAPSVLCVPGPGSEASVLAHVPLVNIAAFGMCESPANPVVATATAAALGVPTPAPCVPVTPAPWVPGDPRRLVDGAPALTMSSACICTWCGMIEVVAPGR